MRMEAVADVPRGKRGSEKGEGREENRWERPQGG